MSTDKPPHIIRASQQAEKGPFHHPHNPRCEMFGTSLGDHVGLTGLGVHLVRIPPGKEAAAYHTHATESEFYYIVSGQARVEIDGVVEDLGAGDFVGLPAPSPPHQLTNPFDTDLVYLVGGERKDVEVAHLPRAGKHVIRVGGQGWTVEDGQLEPFWRRDE